MGFLGAFGQAPGQGRRRLRLALVKQRADGLALGVDVAQHLADIVVEFAGQAFALLQHGRGALLGEEFALQALALAQVGRDPHNPDHAPGLIADWGSGEHDRDAPLASHRCPRQRDSMTGFAHRVTW